MAKHLFVMAFLCLALPLRTGAATKAWDFQAGSSGQRSHFGASTTALDGYDPSDALIVEQTYYLNIATYHDQITDGWTGPAGMFGTDVRGVLNSAIGSTETWRLYCWNDPSYPSTWMDTDFTWYLSTGGMQDKLAWTLTFVRLPTGMDAWDPPSYASPALGQTVLLNNQTEGNWVLWPYRTANGLDGYAFDLTATVIPEPSSLLALLCGVAGLGAVVRRRRV